MSKLSKLRKRMAEKADRLAPRRGPEYPDVYLDEMQDFDAPRIINIDEAHNVDPIYDIDRKPGNSMPCMSCGVPRNESGREGCKAPHRMVKP